MRLAKQKTISSTKPSRFFLFAFVPASEKFVSDEMLKMTNLTLTNCSKKMLVPVRF